MVQDRQDYVEQAKDFLNAAIEQDNETSNLYFKAAVTALVVIADVMATYEPIIVINAAENAHVEIA